MFKAAGPNHWYAYHWWYMKEIQVVRKYVEKNVQIKNDRYCFTFFKIKIFIHLFINLITRFGRFHKLISNGRYIFKILFYNSFLNSSNLALGATPVVILTKRQGGGQLIS